MKAEEAISITENWSSTKQKQYKDDNKIEEHEKDACETLEKLEKFIIKHKANI